MRTNLNLDIRNTFIMHFGGLILNFWTGASCNKGPQICEGATYIYIYS